MAKISKANGATHGVDLPGAVDLGGGALPPVEDGNPERAAEGTALAPASDGYDEMTVAALREELAARTGPDGVPLSATGSKAALVARLREDDAVHAQPADAQGVDGTVHS